MTSFLSRVLRHLVRRETTEMADVQTEKVIQVIAPNDVQFTLNTREEKGEGAEAEERDSEVTVVSSSNSDTFIDADREAVCIDTAAFVGVTISFLMILIIALITIVFLWMRIKSMDRKSLL